MRKILSFLIFLSTIIIFFTIALLSTVGIETSRFNSLITEKIHKTNENFNLQLSKIKFKLDLKEISLFLETSNPRITYKNVLIPTENIKVYVDFLAIMKSEPKIEKINIASNEISISEIKKLSVLFKPSNFTSFLKNKVKDGNISYNLEFYFDNKNTLDNFITRGKVENFETNIIKNINLKKTNFNFFADKYDVILKNFFGETEFFQIEEGDLKLKISSQTELDANFKTNLKINKKKETLSQLLKKFEISNEILVLNAAIQNNFSIKFDKTYKIKEYNYRGNGKISNAAAKISKPLKSKFLEKDIKKIFLKNSDIKTSFNLIKNNTSISGKYSLDDRNYLPFNLSAIRNQNLLKLKLDAAFKQLFGIELINYQKAEGDLANIEIDLIKNNQQVKINKISYVEGKNSIIANGIRFKKNSFLDLDKLEVKTVDNGIENNNFTLSYGKKITIKGKKFDGTNLPKFLNQTNNRNIFNNINNDIEIDFSNIIAPLSENLEDFKLIGKVEKGKFTKIISKGDFGGNNFLDISMKKDKKNNKRFLEIYSDNTKPLLTEFSFFKGLTGGKLLYSSVIEENAFSSKLKIENFKVVNAPGMVKLLSLADLRGLADLAEGEGLSFDILEITMEKENSNLNLKEIIALGPSISVLMEGYQNPKTTSIRGTLVPAKTLNKMISKIPVIGDIVIPKELGEGLFGISFKMKGPPGKIKTTINPIRTLTPRFIQKIIDKSKSSK